jgi:hypothetical protein
LLNLIALFLDVPPWPRTVEILISLRGFPFRNKTKPLKSRGIREKKSWSEGKSEYF